MKCTIRKKIYSWAWSNRKPTEVQKLQSVDVPLRKAGINNDRRGWSSTSCGDFSIFLFAALQFSCLVCLSNIYRFRRTEFPHTVWYFRSLPTKFQGNSHLINLFKDGTLAEKRGRLFWMGNHKWINVSIRTNAHLPLPLTERWP